MKRAATSLSLLLSLVLAVPAIAQQSMQVRIASANANLRQGPNTSEPIVGQLPVGTVLEVVSRAESWYQVRLAADLGISAPTAFVHESLVQPIATPAPGRAPMVQQTYTPPPAYGATGSSPPNQLTRAAGFKDPGTARLFSLVITGGGQFYSGETMKGATILGVALAGVYGGSALAYGNATDCFDDYDSGNYYDCTSSIAWPAYAGYGVAIASWIYGIMDADDSANRANYRNGLTAGPFSVAPVLTVGGNGHPMLGLNLDF